MTRNVTGKILHLDGTPWNGGIVKFELRTGFSTSTATYPKYTHSETLDVNGEFSIDLEVPDSGAALYKIVLPDNSTYEVYIADGVPTNIQTLITVASTPSSPNDLQTLLDANNVLAITYTDADLTLTSMHEYVWSDGTVTITLPATTASGKVYFVKATSTGSITPAVTGSDTINETTPLVIPADTVAWYADIEVGNWHSNW